MRVHPDVHPRNRLRWFLLLVASFVVTGLFDLPRCAQASAGGELKVYISEYKRDKNSGDDEFEISNEEESAVDIGCWTIEASGGSHKIEEGTTVPAGGSVVVTAEPIVDSVTDDIELIDDLKAPLTANLIDRVRFGTSGGAPAAPIGVDDASLCRAPATSTLPPQAPADDENYWTIDLTSTLGSPNDAPDPALGTSLLINEVRIGFGGPDSLEIYNPTSTPVDLDGWFATSAADAVFLAGTVLGFGVLALEVDGLDFENTFRVDLFNASSVRVDQKGWNGAPNPRPSGGSGGSGVSGRFAGLAATDCYGSCPDGDAPSNGYDFGTSGGELSWFGLPCSLGEGNEVVDGGPCVAAEVPSDDFRVVLSSWGRVKTRYE